LGLKSGQIGTYSVGNLIFCELFGFSTPDWEKQEEKAEGEPKNNFFGRLKKALKSEIPENSLPAYNLY
jgi:hypothetical protein